MIIMVMMMAVRAMYMAMLQFFMAGIAYVYHADIVIKGYTGQGRVAIDGDFIAVDFGNGDGNEMAVIGLRMELHANGYFVAIFKHVAFNNLGQ